MSLGERTAARVSESSRTFAGSAQEEQQMRDAVRDALVSIDNAAWKNSPGTDDTIYIQDDEADRVKKCGPGVDTVYFDRRIDSVNPLDCENRIMEPPPSQ